MSHQFAVMGTFVNNKKTIGIALMVTIIEYNYFHRSFD